MKIEDILKTALIGKKLIRIGRKVFENTTIVGVEDIRGWEHDGQFMCDSGVSIMLRIESPFKTTVRQRLIQIDLDDDLIVE
jgi:hypothetical protein